MITRHQPDGRCILAHRTAITLKSCHAVEALDETTYLLNVAANDQVRASVFANPQQRQVARKDIAQFIDWYYTQRGIRALTINTRVL